MFRAIVKQREHLDSVPIADIFIKEASISEDKTQAATSSFTVDTIPKDSNGEKVIKSGDIFGVYDGTGEFIYWGVIDSITESDITEDSSYNTDNTISTYQFEAIYNDSHLITPMTASNQKNFFQNSSVSSVIDFILTSKEMGYLSIANTMSATYTPKFSTLVDLDTKHTFRNISHTIYDTDEARVPFPLEKETVNLESYLYEMFSTYNRVIRPFLKYHKLPDGYQSLEYIQTSGNAYINTGISPATYLNTLRIELDASFVNAHSTGQQYILSSGYYNNTASNQRNILIGEVDNNFRMLNGASRTSYISMGASDTERTMFVIDQIKKFYKLNSYADFSTTLTSNLTNPIILGALYDTSVSGAPITNFTEVKIYGLKIFNSGELIQWLIPCYRTSDNEAGLYDIVSDQFLTNSGSGELIKSSALTDKSFGVAIFNPEGEIVYDGLNTWDYNKKVLFDTFERVKNVSLVQEDVETNTVLIFNSNDTPTLIGAYTVLKDGSVQQIVTYTEVPERLGTGKTKYIFDSSNKVDDIIRANIPANSYNHKITFDIIFSDEYPFTDFKLGQHISFFKNGKEYDSILSAWNYSFDQNDNQIKAATFTLGNVRTDLTSKLNIIKANTKKK